MAPTPRSASPVKGKFRVYLCRPCNVRHAAPSGNKCPIAKAIRGVQGSTKTLGMKRTATGHSPKARTSTSRPRSRPRKIPAQAPPSPVHEPMLFQDTPTSRHIPLPDDDEDMESVDDFLPLTQVPVLKRPLTPPYALSDPKRTRPVMAIRRTAHTDRILSPTSSLSSMPSFTPEPPAPTNQPDAATQMILQQLATMQEMNRKEFAHIEAQNKAERLRMQAENQANVDSLRVQFNSVLDSPRWPAPPHEPRPSTSVNAHQQTPPPPAPWVVSFAQHTEVTEPPALASTWTQLQTKAPAVGLSLDGQPPEVNVCPEQIALEESPIKSLRRDQQTSNVAELMLSEVGLAKMIELDKSSNKSGVKETKALAMSRLRNRPESLPPFKSVAHQNSSPVQAQPCTAYQKLTCGLLQIMLLKVSTVCIVAHIATVVREPSILTPKVNAENAIAVNNEQKTANRPVGRKHNFTTDQSHMAIFINHNRSAYRRCYRTRFHRTPTHLA